MGSQAEGAGEGNAPASDPKKDALYEDRPTSKKIIRVVTVIAYMVSVSFVAIVLSAYYVFLWQPPNPRLMHRAHLRADPQIEYLVDAPPKEVVGGDAVNGTRDKVELFREEILRARGGVNVSFRSPPAPAPTPSLREDGETRNNANDSRRWNPIVRALFAAAAATTRIATPQNSNGSVYGSVDVSTAKSWTVTDSLEPSTLFTDATRSPDLSSAASSISTSTELLPDGSAESHDPSPKNFASTTATTRVDYVATSATNNRSSSGDGEKLVSGKKSSEDIARIRPDPAHLTGSPESRAVDLERVGSFAAAGASTINTSAVAGKNSTLANVSSGESGPSDVTQRHDRSTAPLEFTVNPDAASGSQIARVPTKSTANGTEAQEMLRTSASPEEPASIEIVPEAVSDEEAALPEPPGSVVPAVVQPDDEFVGKKEESNQRITQDGDFGFV